MVRSSRTWETTPFLAARVSEGQLQEDLVDRTPLLATSRAGRLSIWAILDARSHETELGTGKG